MKILSVVSTLNFEYRMGTTPMVWLLTKALHSIGHTVVVSTYLGRAIESPWWRSYPNPCEIESRMYNWYADRTTARAVGQSEGVLSTVSKLAIKSYVTPKWERHLIDICAREKPDCLLFILVPLGHIAGIATKIRQRFSIPVLFYDGDLPSSLTNADSKMFKFSMYKDADISEYDCFLSCSKGILPRLREMGAKRAEAVYYASDPSVFSPLEGIEKDIDVFYYGHRSAGKEQQFDYMMAEASKQMSDKIFVVGGVEHEYDIGKCKRVGRLSLGEWRYWCARSKINLNITKSSDSCIYASSSARPFELAAMGCCVVSDPYLGMRDEWYAGGHLFELGDLADAILIYKTFLKDAELRKQYSQAALKDTLEKHTYEHRAKQIIEIIRSL